jgi:hypothetical protein
VDAVDFGAAVGAAFGAAPALGAGTTGAPGFGIDGDPAAPPGFGAPGFGIPGVPAAPGAFGALGTDAARGSLIGAAGTPVFFGRFTVGSAFERGSTASCRISSSRLLSSPSAEISCSASSRSALSTRSQLILFPFGSAVTTSLPAAS